MKKIICFSFLSIYSICCIFCLELRLKSIETNYNMKPFSCGVNGSLFFYKNDIINIRKCNNGNYDYFDIIRIKDNGEKSVCYDISELKDNSIYSEYNDENVTYKLKYGYKMLLSSYLRGGSILSSESYRQNKPSMFNHLNFHPVPYFFYVMNENDECVFDFNDFRLKHEEFYPRGQYTSTSRYEEFSEKEAKRILSNDSAWTMYQGCASVNRKQNRIAIILNQYNVYDDALCIFEVLYDAVCNDDKVRVRKEPNLNCDTVTFINKNDSVKIKDQSDRKFEIDGEEWYWHEVELPDGKTGWVYGKYLDIEK